MDGSIEIWNLALLTFADHERMLEWAVRFFCVVIQRPAVRWRSARRRILLSAIGRCPGETLTPLTHQQANLVSSPPAMTRFSLLPSPGRSWPSAGC